MVLHDLPESNVGDIVPGEVTQKKRAEENNAIETILQSIPPCIRSDYKGISLEYLLNKTDIARLVHDCGELRWVLQARRYVSEGYPEHLLTQFLDFPKNTCMDLQTRNYLNRYKML